MGLVKVADGFENANGIVSAGDDRLFVVEQEGYVVLLKRRDDGTFRKAGTFLDISGRVICCGEKGMLGLAFPPDYAETGYFYVTFAGSGHTWNLEERRVSKGDPDRADPEYKRRVIRVYKPRDYHWAGDIHFGPDGYLYVTIGDGGFGGDIDDPGDPENRAQDLGVIFGKMLRISPRRGREDGERYGIPDSNPFVDTRGAKPEIWAYGLRNPWRWSFDRVTGDLWIGDVGMWRWEEVDRATAPRAGKGLNFGWRLMEGPVCYNPPKGCRTDELTMPHTSLAHRNGVCAVTGGYVYRGERYPRLRSWYVFADYCSGRIYLLDSAGKRGQRPKARPRHGLPVQRARRGRGRRAVRRGLRAGQHHLPHHRQEALSRARVTSQAPMEDRMSDLAPDVREFLTVPGRYATLATIDPDGSPLQAVVWYDLLDDGGILLNSLDGRRWPANLRRDPRASITVEDGYDYVSMRGDGRVPPRW